MATLNRQQIKDFYDRFGKKQDWQALFEGAPVQALVEHGAFAEASRVFEFGCGTGRLAETLLDRHLPPNASYYGVDISDTMISLASARLKRFGGRAQSNHTNGSLAFDFEAETFERFVATYVFDLLSPKDTAAILREAKRLLSAGGLLCLVSLTSGFTPTSRLVARTWRALYRLRPQLVGGCRPIELSTLIADGNWQVRYQKRFSTHGFPSEVLVAEKVGGD